MKKTASGVLKCTCHYLSFTPSSVFLTSTLQCSHMPNLFNVPVKCGVIVYNSSLEYWRSC